MAAVVNARALIDAPRDRMAVVRLCAMRRSGAWGPHRAREKPPTLGRLVTVSGPCPSGRLDEVLARSQRVEHT